jgi:hypothetical protein
MTIRPAYFNSAGQSVCSNHSIGNGFPKTPDFVDLIRVLDWPSEILVYPVVMARTTTIADYRP